MNNVRSGRRLRPRRSVTAMPVRGFRLWALLFALLTCDGTTGHSCHGSGETCRNAVTPALVQTAYNLSRVVARNISSAQTGSADIGVFSFQTATTAGSFIPHTSKWSPGDLKCYGDVVGMTIHAPSDGGGAGVGAGATVLDRSGAATDDLTSPCYTRHVTSGGTYITFDSHCDEPNLDIQTLAGVNQRAVLEHFEFKNYDDMISHVRSEKGASLPAVLSISYGVPEWSVAVPASHQVGRLDGVSRQ